MTQILCLNVSQIDSNGYQRLYAAARPERRKKADRCRHFADSLRCIAADALLRYAVRQTLSVSEYVVEYNFYGKPYLKDQACFHYNISHSGHWVVIGFGDHELGIDVEKMDMKAAKEAIARRFFTPEEQDSIFHLTDPDLRARQFFRIWTAKESYLKYLGTGLNRPLNSFCVVSDETELGVHLQSFFLEDGYSLSLCTNDRDVKSIRSVPQHCLLAGNFEE